MCVFSHITDWISFPTILRQVQVALSIALIVRRYQRFMKISSGRLTKSNAYRFQSNSSANSYGVFTKCKSSLRCVYFRLAKFRILILNRPPRILKQPFNLNVRSGPSINIFVALCDQWNILRREREREKEEELMNFI